MGVNYMYCSNPPLPFRQWQKMQYKIKAKFPFDKAKQDAALRKAYSKYSGEEQP